MRTVPKEPLRWHGPKRKILGKSRQDLNGWLAPACTHPAAARAAVVLCHSRAPCSRTAEESATAMQIPAGVCAGDPCGADHRAEYHPPSPAERGEEHGAAGGSTRAGVPTATRRPAPRLGGGSVVAVWWCCGVAVTRYPCAHPRVRCDCATKICLDKPAARPTAREQGAPRGPGGAPW